MLEAANLFVHSPLKNIMAIRLLGCVFCYVQLTHNIIMHMIQIESAELTVQAHG